jgi:hypothetical protein
MQDPIILGLDSGLISLDSSAEPKRIGSSVGLITHNNNIFNINTINYNKNNNICNTNNTIFNINIFNYIENNNIYNTNNNI